MINDKLNEFTKDTSATVRGALSDSTGNMTAKIKVMDAGKPIDWGAGDLVVPYAEILSGAAETEATSVKIDIVASSTVALTGTAVILSTITILNAVFAAITTGLLFPMPALLAGQGTRRYLGAIFTFAGGGGAAQWVVGLREKSAGAQSYGSTVVS